MNVKRAEMNFTSASWAFQLASLPCKKIILVNMFKENPTSNQELNIKQTYNVETIIQGQRRPRRDALLRWLWDWRRGLRGWHIEDPQLCLKNFFSRCFVELSSMKSKSLPINKSLGILITKQCTAMELKHNREPIYLNKNEKQQSSTDRKSTKNTFL